VIYGVDWYGVLLERVLEAHEACRRWRCSTLSDPDDDDGNGDDSNVGDENHVGDTDGDSVK